MEQKRVHILEVPYAEKDQAKTLGARWSPEFKKWYVYQPQNFAPFQRWSRQDKGYGGLTYETDAIVLIAESKTVCWNCKKDSLVVALGGQLDPKQLFPPYVRAFLFGFVRSMPKDVQEDMAIEYPKFRWDYSNKTRDEYFMNHCEHCDAKLGDWYLHNEPGGAFFPTTEADIKGIRPIETGFNFRYRLYLGLEEEEDQEFFDGFEIESHEHNWLCDDHQ